MRKYNPFKVRVYRRGDCDVLIEMIYLKNEDDMDFEKRILENAFEVIKFSLKYRGVPMGMNEKFVGAPIHLTLPLKFPIRVPIIVRCYFSIFLHNDYNVDRFLEEFKI